MQLKLSKPELLGVIFFNSILSIYNKFLTKVDVVDWILECADVDIQVDVDGWPVADGGAGCWEGHRRALHDLTGRNRVEHVRKLYYLNILR